VLEDLKQAVIEETEQGSVGFRAGVRWRAKRLEDAIVKAMQHFGATTLIGPRGFSAAEELECDALGDGPLVEDPWDGEILPAVPPWEAVFLRATARLAHLKTLDQGNGRRRSISGLF